MFPPRMRTRKVTPRQLWTRDDDDLVWLCRVARWACTCARTCQELRGVCASLRRTAVERMVGAMRSTVPSPTDDGRVAEFSDGDTMLRFRLAAQLRLGPGEPVPWHSFENGHRLEQRLFGVSKTFSYDNGLGSVYVDPSGTVTAVTGPAVISSSVKVDGRAFPLKAEQWHPALFRAPPSLDFPSGSLPISADGNGASVQFGGRRWELRTLDVRQLLCERLQLHFLEQFGPLPTQVTCPHCLAGRRCGADSYTCPATKRTADQGWKVTGPVHKEQACWVRDNYPDPFATAEEWRFFAEHVLCVCKAVGIAPQGAAVVPMAYDTRARMHKEHRRLEEVS